MAYQNRKYDMFELAKKQVANNNVREEVIF